MPESENVDLEARLAAVERLTRLFQFERFVYLGVTILALVMLLGVAATLIMKQKAGAGELSGLFGSSGLITYSCGRLLHMWNRAIGTVFSIASADDK